MTVGVDSYENEFESLTSQVQHDLGAFAAATDGKNISLQGERASQLELTFEKCHVLLRNLRLEARNYDNDEKEELLSRINLYKIQLKALQEHFKTCKIDCERDGFLKLKSQMNNSGENTAKERTPTLNSSRSISNDQPQRANNNLDSRLKLTKQNQTLERARRSLAEVENLAGGISENLASNRQIIETSREKTEELHRMTDDADNIMTRMKKRWF